MKFRIQKNKWDIVLILIAISVVIPIVIIAFELITTEKESVVLLEGYPTSIALLILIYYLILMLIGLYWFIKQIISFWHLKNERVKSELLHLKSQVNPHFFFNSLNNLYGLIDIDSRKAKELILKLSDIMRYSIYEGDKESVSLKKEVDFLKNYVDLHTMRYHKKIDTDIDIQIDKDCQIMPLLFIILLENAFKHGVERLNEGAYVNVKVTAEENTVVFEIRNNFEPSHNQNNEGIGLKNLKRRLELVYPQKHVLLLSELENEYFARLTLKL